VRARWPGLQPPDGFTCLYEPGAGFLDVERCVRAHLASARRHGAELRGQAQVLEWSADDHGVTVVTAGQRYHAGALVVAAGPWSAPMLAELALPLRVHRVMQLWFGAGPEMSVAHGTPCYAFDVAGHFVYGFPKRGPLGAKICEHAAGEELAVSDLGRVDRELREADTAAVLRVIRAYLPHVEPRIIHSKPCFYTMTPDQDFIVDTHPRHPRVAFAAGFSGHGFKFASVIGEILADLALRGRTELPIEFLRQRWS
jgi:sarcosine oxidase